MIITNYFSDFYAFFIDVTKLDGQERRGSKRGCGFGTSQKELCVCV